ncbi:MAG: HNH endonuclease [Methyloligellaceae bacterium]
MVRPNYKAMMRMENAFKKAFRQDALLKQSRKCYYCYDIMNYDTVTAEHVKPRMHGGSTTRKNIKAACLNCNGAKAAMPKRQFLKIIRNPPPEASMQIKVCYIRHRLNRAIDRACDKLVKRS